MILVIKLFYIQIIKHNHYDIQLSKQYYKESFFLPERGNIFALDKGGHTVQLTQNITFYDLALDPKDLTEFPPKTEGGTPIPMKPRFIELIAPIIYQHLCELNGMHVPTKTECVKNVELFAGVDLLPQQPELFYYGSGELSPAYESFDFTGYQEHFDKVVQQFTQEQAMQLIMKRLDEKIKI